MTVTVDDDVAEAVQAAVGSGAAASVSAWVNEALVERVARDRRAKALETFLDAYEEEHGAFTDEELAAIERRSRAESTVVRGTSHTVHGGPADATPA